MLDVNEILTSSKKHFFLVGKNGSGKSALLRNLAEKVHELGYSTIAVSNTLFDKFSVHPESLNYDYIGSKLGRNFPTQAIKKTLSTESESRVSRIFSVLSHIGYDKQVGIKIRFKRKFKDAIRYSITRTGEFYPVYFDDSDLEIHDELKAAIDKAIHQINYGCSVLIWLKDSDNVFYESNFNSYLQLLKYEQLLKKARIISGIDVILCKNGCEFPLTHASSGELSFISLLVHIAFCVNDRSLIFIDEPENSLHPKWQRDYFELLKGAIGYNNCTTVIATHSPLIISTTSEHSKTAIYKRQNAGFHRVNSYDDNAEELYIDYFDTLTPKNRALSNRCVDIIDLLTEGKISLKKARQRLSRYFDMASDDAQKNFLIGVDTLLSKIETNKVVTRD
ncbi:TPA: ATP-binding protein [Serratia marcescens]|nr:ATP-binding protein [Serratia marcescens]